MPIQLVLFLYSSFCVADASQIKAKISEGSAQQLWQQAWGSVLQQNGIDADQVNGMPEELKDHLLHKAENTWKSWMQERKGSEPSTTATTAEYDEPSTTVNYAMQRLLAGVEPGYPVSSPEASFSQESEGKVETTSTTTTMAAATTSTEDPKVQQEKQHQQQQLLELRNSFMHKLTDGMGKIDAEDATATTTTVTSTTTTTTVNPYKARLLEGMEESAPVAGAKPTTTTSTTSTATMTQTIGEAGKKTLAFIMEGAGHFVMPHHHAMDEQAPPEDDDNTEEDDDKKASDDAEYGEGKVAEEFDMDNAS